MSTYENSGDEKDTAPVWKHGPDGELGIGPLNWQRFRELALVFCLPSVLLMFFARDSSAFIIFCGSIVAASRLARFDGTPALVQGLTTHWGTRFAVAAGALFALHFVAEKTGGTLLGMAYWPAVLVFIYAVGIYGEPHRLLAWEPSGTNGGASEVSIADLKALRDEIEAGRASLASLPVFDDKKPELVEAWEKRQTQLIAHFLQEGNLLTQDSWKQANSIFNRAQRHLDRARRKLNGLFAPVEERLAAFNFDYAAIEIERSKLSQIEMSAAIPENLTVKRIGNQTTAFYQGGGRAIAQGVLGQLPPLAAVAMLGVAIIANKLYESRTLRRLKDVEGQLLVNSKAVRGDCATVETVFVTRILPQFDGIIDVASRFDSGLADLNSEVIDASNPVQRDKALKLAFALIEGRKLVATMGGN